MRPVLSLQVTARAKAKLLSFGDLCPSNCTDIGRKKETSCVRRYQPLHPSDCCWQRMARRYRESESTSTFLSSCKSEMTRGLNCVFISSPSPHTSSFLLFAVSQFGEITTPLVGIFSNNYFTWKNDIKRKELYF